MIDTKGRFLADLQKNIALHSTFGIDSYPLCDELRHFFKTAKPLKPVPAAKPSAPPATTRKPHATKNTSVKLNASSLTDVRQQLGDCDRCPLHKGRGSILFGRGAEDADLFIIGEYPNTADDAQGILFSGEDGELLNKMLNAIGLEMEQVYIASIVKCRTDGKRQPAAKEISTCLPFLMAQLAVVKPKIICAMGSLAAQVLLKSQQPLIRLRGRWRQLNGIPLMATFHPSFLLKNGEMKRAAWQDLQAIQKKLA